MSEYTKNVIDFAFDNKLSDMQDSIQNAISAKISDALDAKKIEVAQGMFGVTESLELDEISYDDILSMAKEVTKGKNATVRMRPSVEQQKKERDELIAARKEKSDKNPKPKEPSIIHQDAYPLGGYDRMSGRSYSESTELEEKLDPSMGVKKYIDDFIKSDNPKFEGKSKKERIQMALGAFYSAKKDKTRNEEVEELEELSSETRRSYRNKAAVSVKSLSGQKNVLDQVKSSDDDVNASVAHIKADVKRKLRNRSSGILRSTRKE